MLQEPQNESLYGQVRSTPCRPILLLPILVLSPHIPCILHLPSWLNIFHCALTFTSSQCMPGISPLMYFILTSILWRFKILEFPLVTTTTNWSSVKWYQRVLWWSAVTAVAFNLQDLSEGREEQFSKHSFRRFYHVQQTAVTMDVNRLYKYSSAPNRFICLIFAVYRSKGWFRAGSCHTYSTPALEDYWEFWRSVYDVFCLLCNNRSAVM